MEMAKDRPLPMEAEALLISSAGNFLIHVVVGKIRNNPEHKDRKNPIEVVSNCQKQIGLKEIFWVVFLGEWKDLKQQIGLPGLTPGGLYFQITDSRQRFQKVL